MAVYERQTKMKAALFGTEARTQELLSRAPLPPVVVPVAVLQHPEA